MCDTSLEGGLLTGGQLRGIIAPATKYDTSPFNLPTIMYAFIILDLICARSCVEASRYVCAIWGNSGGGGR